MSFTNLGKISFYYGMSSLIENATGFKGRFREDIISWSSPFYVEKIFKCLPLRRKLSSQVHSRYLSEDKLLFFGFTEYLLGYRIV